MSDTAEIAKRLRERAARISGPAPRIVRQGEVWAVADELVVLPEDRLRTEPRKLHDERFVIVIQDSSSLALPAQQTVSVVPCSASHRPGPLDVEFDDQPNGFSKPNVVAFVSLVQPMLVDDLKRRTGTVEDDCLMTLGGALLRLWGMSEIAGLLLQPSK